MASGDKIICPYCGAEMWFPDTAWEKSGLDMGGYKWHARGKCRSCGALSPDGYGRTNEEAMENARAAALRRYTPSKWRSVKDSLPETDGKYIVCTTKGSVYCAKFTTRYGAYFHTDSNTHIAYWMAMPDKPTDEEKSAAGWRE